MWTVLAWLLGPGRRPHRRTPGGGECLSVQQTRELPPQRVGTDIGRIAGDDRAAPADRRGASREAARLRPGCNSSPEGACPGAGKALPPQGSPHSKTNGPGTQARRCRREVAPRLARRPEAVAFDQPLLVVPSPELPQGLGQFRDGGERSNPEEVLLECADEAFRDPIGLRSRMHPIRTISLDVSA